MSASDRYLWGETKADRIRITDHIILTGLATPPEAEGGILYRDSATGKLMLCADSTNFETVTSS